MGLGLFGGGAAVTRALARRGARLTVTDLKPADLLRESVAALEGFDVALHLGGHREEDFTGADLVVVNPGVPADSPYLRAAAEAGVPLESETNLFFKWCRAERIVGVTGSNGKTTTTALIGEILSRGPQRVRVGGNIGRPLIEQADRVAPGEIVVLELSSFQLEHLGAIGRSPRVAVVMNLTPNHLDRHGTMEEYARAKRQIVAHQGEDDWNVLNRDDEAVRGFAELSPARTSHFSIRQSVAHGTWASGDGIHLRAPDTEATLDVSKRILPGWFNLQNMAAAAAATFVAAGGDWRDWGPACEDVFSTFRGVEHRLEYVGETGGVRVYNDSIATNPESTVAALGTLAGPIVLIAGGYDKKLAFEGLAAALHGRVRLLVLTGETAGAIERSVRAVPEPPEIVRAAAFDDAVRLAPRACRSGDTLLLSPACASFDQFRNFAERGRRFKQLVREHA
jgi:UDP-N-acetylmuramoylalanine--D-glutamate ligase